MQNCKARGRVVCNMPKRSKAQTETRIKNFMLKEMSHSERIIKGHLAGLILRRAVSHLLECGRIDPNDLDAAFNLSTTDVIVSEHVDTLTKAREMKPSRMSQLIVDAEIEARKSINNPLNRREPNNG
jgi:hypothetical protein